MAYTTIDNPGLFFETILWTGDGASTRSITGVGFQPDWIWVKCRSTGHDHYSWDSVRTNKKGLEPSDTSAERTPTLGSIDSDGFSFASLDSFYNANSDTYVGWNWKAGNSSGSSDGNGSITSTVSADTTSGFSIVAYTGNASNGASFGHGLGVKPQIVIIKNRDTAKNWVYWQDTTGNGTSDVRFILNGNNSNYNNYHVTFGTNTITLGDTDDAWNKSGDNLIAYCFAEKQGYSKFASYTGNGNADGTFVYTGFKPAWILIKDTASTQSWFMYDNKRDTINPNTKLLTSNNSSTEEDSASTGNTFDVDFLSNGFKIRTTDGGVNSSGNGYVYMAFAETPFVTAGTKAAGTAK